MKIGQTLNFTYRGREVTCTVERIDSDGFLGKLLSDYNGKNESWYPGENKWFQLNLINK